MYLAVTFKGNLSHNEVSNTLFSMETMYYHTCQVSKQSYIGLCYIYGCRFISLEISKNFCHIFKQVVGNITKFFMHYLDDFKTLKRELL